VKTDRAPFSRNASDTNRPRDLGLVPRFLRKSVDPGWASIVACSLGHRPGGPKERHRAQGLGRHHARSRTKP